MRNSGSLFVLQTGPFSLMRLYFEHFSLALQVFLPLGLLIQFYMELLEYLALLLDSGKIPRMAKFLKSSFRYLSAKVIYLGLEAQVENHHFVYFYHPIFEFW